MTQSFGTVMIGGAVMGSSVAYFLTENVDYDNTVCVIEPDPTYVDSSTMRSNGSIRHQFSTPANIAISQFGTEFISDFHHLTEVNGQSPELGFRDTGYLFLADAASLPAFEASHQVQKQAGVAATMLDEAGLRERFVHLNTDGLVGGSIGERHEGTFDPWALLQGFKQRAQANGATYVTDRVVGIDHDGQVAGVLLESGARIDTSRIVNCAGPRARLVANMVGLDIPVEPRLRSSFVFACETAIDGPFPLHIDPSGVHVRREGPYFLAGTKPVNDGPSDPTDLDVRRDEFEELVWPVLAHRIPQFEAILLKSAWGGHYAYNTLDQNMIVGVTPIPGFYLANGFSGHGLQQSPGVGRAISELITYGEYRSIDLTDFGFDRVSSERPIFEQNVI